MSNQDTTIQELLDLCLKFRDDRDWKQFHTPKDLTVAMAIEVSEILEHLRFKSDVEIADELKDDQKKLEIGYELADALYFLLLLSDAVGVDLADIFKKNLKITAKKYPIHLSRGSNKKYTQLSFKEKNP
ncbi:TPA: nucleotide pyrophosphohydrolase [Candidatus Poribacteria bacterium]|nr:nucleotide pyrophosphohydrolase [Candidatus Poribacteria bacterium]